MCLVLVHPAVPRTKKHKPGVTEPIQMIKGGKAYSMDPWSRSPRLPTRAFSTEGVNSLGSKKNGIIVLFIETRSLITLS